MTQLTHRWSFLTVVALLVAANLWAKDHGDDAFANLKPPLRAENAAALTAAEMAELLAEGQSGRWKSAASTNIGTIRFNADGTAHVTWSRGSADGNWRLRDNANCTTWDYRPDKESCNVYFLVGPDTYETYHVDDGKIDGLIIFDGQGVAE